MCKRKQEHFFFRTVGFSYCLVNVLAIAFISVTQGFCSLVLIPVPPELPFSASQLFVGLFTHLHVATVLQLVKLLMINTILQKSRMLLILYKKATQNTVLI